MKNLIANIKAAKKAFVLAGIFVLAAIGLTGIASAQVLRPDNGTVLSPGLFTKVGAAIVTSSASDTLGSSARRIEAGYFYTIDALNLAISGSVTGNFAVTGNTTLGDASGDVTIINGRLGINNSAPANSLTVGSSTSTFEVDASGNILKVNNVAYSWPSSQGDTNTVLTNNGSGTLTWGAAGGASTLNQAYNAATGTPQISLTPSVGTLAIADTQGGFGEIFRVQNRVDAAGNFGTRYFSVSSTNTSMTSVNTTLDGVTINGGTALTSGRALTVTGGGTGTTTGGAASFIGPSGSTGTVNSSGATILSDMAGNPTIANNGGSNVFKCSGCTSGNNLVIQAGDSQTTGFPFLVTGRPNLTNNSIAKIEKFAAAARTTAFTGSVLLTSHVDTYTGGGSTSNTGNTALFSRTINVTNAAATPLYSGALMSLVDNTSVSAGSITHSAPVLSISQTYASSVGNAFDLSSAAMGGPLMSLRNTAANSALTTTLFSIGGATKNVMTVSATSTAFAGSTGSVSANAVTCNGTVCRITDTTDINLASTRAAITLTNSAISATSNVHVGLCGTQDSGAMIVGSAIPGAGSATIALANAGTGNQTTTLDICVTVFGSL